MVIAVIQPFKAIGDFNEEVRFEIQGEDVEHAKQVAKEYCKELLLKDDNIFEYRWQYKNGMQGYYETDFNKWSKLLKEFK
jgi:hypothetical protein